MVTRMAHTQHLERTAIQALGVRAIWLHLQLTGIEALALSPRDRDLLTVVATRPNGMPLDGLLRRLSATAALHRVAGLHWIQRLVDQGWLSLREEDAGTYVDLAVADLEWVDDQISQLHTD